MGKDSLNEIEIMGEIDKILSEVSDEQMKGRILKWASAKFAPNLVSGDKLDTIGQNNTQLNEEEFFTKFLHDKPSNNVLLIAAWHYGKYGTSSIRLCEIRAKAKEVGITIPDRPDMTMKAATRKGKSLFIPCGRGEYRPTVHGEKYFKETYQVKKGIGKKDEVQE